MADYVLGIPPAIVQLVQTGLLERAFHDGLFPALMFRAEAVAEEWEGQTGVEIFMSRPGLIEVDTTPLTPGADPDVAALTFEQWVARIEPFGRSIDTHMPTAKTANSDLFLRNVHQLGLNAGQTLNRLPRDAMFKAYLSGSTVLTAATSSGDTSIAVASVNGFTDVINTGTDVRPVPVSSTKPLSITITDGVTPITRSVIGFTLVNPNDAFGPGTLLLSATVGATYAARSSILSSARPTIIRSGGGTSVDALGSADTATLQDFINAVNTLRGFNVRPHPDGYFHVHISPTVNSQLFADPVFQRLNQSLPEHVVYKEGFIGTIAGMLFYMNTEAPDPTNSGARTSTGTNAFYSKAIGAETTNNGGVDVVRSLVTGSGVLFEKYLDEGQFVTEAGTTGKIGEFSIVNQGLQIMTERIRMVLRAPQDRLQNMVSTSWSYSGCFPVPSDVSSGGAQRFKRAVVVESAKSA